LESPVELRNARRGNGRQTRLYVLIPLICNISKVLAVHADKTALPQQPREERCRFLAVSSLIIMRRSGIGSPVIEKCTAEETAAGPAMFSFA